MTLEATMSLAEVKVEVEEVAIIMAARSAREVAGSSLLIVEVSLSYPLVNLLYLLLLSRLLIPPLPDG